MNVTALVVCISLVGGLASPAAFAQTTAPAPTTATTATTAAPSTATTAAPAAASGATATTAKAQRQICRQEVKAQNLNGTDARVKMMSCMAPMRENCRKQAVQANVAAGTPRQDFMKKCMSS